MGRCLDALETKLKELGTEHVEGGNFQAAARERTGAGNLCADVSVSPKKSQKSRSPRGSVFMRVTVRTLCLLVSCVKVVVSVARVVIRDTLHLLVHQGCEPFKSHSAVSQNIHRCVTCIHRTAPHHTTPLNTLQHHSTPSHRAQTRTTQHAARTTARTHTRTHATCRTSHTHMRRHTHTDGLHGCVECRAAT